jgi:inner membrane protein
MKSITLVSRICLVSNLVLDTGLLLFIIIFSPSELVFFLLVPVISFVGSIPMLIVMTVLLPIIRKLNDSFINKIYLTILVCGFCACVYGFFAFFLNYFFTHKNSDAWLSDGVKAGGVITGILFGTSLIALQFSKRQIKEYYKYKKPLLITHNQTSMQTPSNPEEISTETGMNPSNKILIKGTITAILIGIMMIPTIFISDLVQERQSRNEAVVKEVDSRWAMAQTLTGPYIYLPYKVLTIDAAGKTIVSVNHLLILPENKLVSGKINHELRDRSIYKVLLYRASLKDQGNFVLNLPKEVGADQVQWSDVQMCFGISDFKGIEERLVIRFNGNSYELSPGLPTNDTSEKGLATHIALSVTDLGKPIDYLMNIKIKGSEMLHFVPLSGNSHFELESSWPSPSFDGSNLPSERRITKDGFTAVWNFNKANLPFGTVLNEFKFDESTLAFGVTMIEPADQYAKTNRSIKYAILIIGLTFSLFFIIELMQRKPIHPVQYVLIGLTLVIFYCLLLAISEFIAFDYAYLIASVGTIMLIGLYAKSHFKTWRSSGIFSGVLTLLYGFIFVLIRLEDTALLVGSIGLFIILALTMYASKKVNWYGNTETPAIQ